MRRTAAVLVVLATVVGGMPITGWSSVAVASPVATDGSTYRDFERVFPDPQGCLPDGPNVSPWRKGAVCSAGYLGWDEALAGLAHLETLFPRYVDVVRLEDERPHLPGLAELDLRSAGLVRTDHSRERFDLYAIQVTDAASPTPIEDRQHVALTLAIHGDERSGVEGGLRAIEDLATWAACADGADVPACATEGPFPKAILEPTSTGPSAGQVLEEMVLVFLLANPDGWVRGDPARGGTVPHRPNGHGADLNRDWPVRGYVEPLHTPWSEPESVGLGRYLEQLRDRTTAGAFAAAVDFHGMPTAHSLSFMLILTDEHDFVETQRLVATAQTTFADAEVRLTWSPHVAPARSCPGPVPEPFFGRSMAPMCTDQWGTLWETIGYNASGGLTSWAGSDLGLGATSFANEMSNLGGPGFNTTPTPDAIQLQIDATKGLLYSALTAALAEAPPGFRPKGRIAYLDDPSRTSHPGGTYDDHTIDLPHQEPIVVSNVPTGTPVEFDVLGPTDGYRNGGLLVDARFANVHGTAPFTAPMTLQRCGPADHGTGGEECVDVASYLPNSDQGHAGVRLEINDPIPGRYRIEHRLAEDPLPAHFPAEYHVTFTDAHAYPVPLQEPYDVSRLDFFADLAERTVGPAPAPLDLRRIAATPNALARFDTFVIADDPRPGEIGDRTWSRFVAHLGRWVEDGGNLVLTDGALTLLPHLPVAVDGGAVRRGYFSTGWVDLDDGAGRTVGRHHLAEDTDRPGTAWGRVAVDGLVLDDARELYSSPPLGFYVSPDRRANAVCESDTCDSPIWIVDQGAWEAAGGTTAGRTYVRSTTDGGSPGTVGVSLGEVGVGAGVVRIVGALLPEPVQHNYHPYGLSSYAVTPSGYAILENLLDWRVRRAPSSPTLPAYP